MPTMKLRPSPSHPRTASGFVMPTLALHPNPCTYVAEAAACHWASAARRSRTAASPRSEAILDGGVEGEFAET